MFTRAIDTAFSSKRIIDRGDANLTVGHQKQEATAQALLDYILHQGEEAAVFGKAVGIPSGQFVQIGKEEHVAGSRRVDHTLIVDDIPAAYIEDKVWANFGLDQLRDYGDDLQNLNDEGKLIVIVPHRRLGKAIREVESSRISEFTEVIAWEDLPKLMAGLTENMHLWSALSTFASEIGSSNLVDISFKGSFPQGDGVGERISKFLNTASEISDLYHLTRSKHSGSRPSRRTFSFSTNRRNPRAWLQAGATQDDIWGLEIDPGYERKSGIWLVHPHVADAFDLKIGSFKHSLSAAARERIKQLAEDSVEDELDFSLYGSGLSRLGTYLDDDGQNALVVLMRVFDLGTAGNYLPQETSWVSVNDHPSRHGMRFTLGNRRVEAFMGPPEGESWIRPSIFLRDDGGDREVKPYKHDTGKDYVERVWSTISDSLTG